MLNKKLKTNESGRSMVEMLGVLAIVGVLSIGGIAGYTAAMDSHRANQAVNTAMRLAMLASNKRLSNPTSKLEGDELSAGFTMSEDANHIVLTATGFSDAVRTKIAGMNFKTATLGEDAQGNLTFTFENDLSEGSGETDSIDIGTCEAGKIYVSYMDPPCQTAPANIGCTKNSDCASDEYCKIVGTWQNDCSVITGGTCETLDAGTPKTYTHDRTTKELLLGEFMSWWAAENWCKAHHKSLVQASTLGCTVSGTSGSCPSEAYSDMSSAELGYYYWTADSYDSCKAWYVFLGDEGFIGGHYRSNDQPALCE